MNQATITREQARLQPQSFEPTASFDDTKAQQAQRATNDKPNAFKMRAQLLEQGRSETVLAASPQLSVRLKVYASGGENALHAHATEDHVFIILQGEAEFFDEDGPLALLGRNEGLLVPRGCYYRFNATSQEELVMLRVGGPNEAFLGLEGRVNIHGSFMHADSAENKMVTRVVKPGQYFGD